MEKFTLKEIIQNLGGFIDTPIGKRKYPIEVVESVKALKEMIEPDSIVVDTKIIAQTYILFSRFVFDLNYEIENLVHALTQIERDLINEEMEKTNNVTEKGLWFRFFKNDTVVTTIQDLENTFKNDYQENKDYVVAKIGEALNHQTLEIHFS